MLLNHNDNLTKQLRNAYLAKGQNYQARTHHLDTQNQPIYINRLILENSPYLLQHAHNPVDWWAWSEEAFIASKQENKPIFLSIGYSTCHWCHVMERESFESEAVSEYLNEHMISIKVDRELMPEVDEVYMQALIMTNGNGGWPLSAFLDFEKRPFFCGTYYPPDYFLKLLQQIHTLWQDHCEEITVQAEKITAALQPRNPDTIADLIEDKQNLPDITRLACENIIATYDKQCGGFSGAPKFPNEPFLFLLLEAGLHLGDQQYLNIVDQSLIKMAQGGIYDHISGGFHRYSTDRNWQIPHFEKMLYNQANLARIYLRAYQLNGKPSNKRVATEILDYVLSEMTATDGGFYSATDADSEGVEGKFFVWTPEQLKTCLSEEEYSLATSLFGITEKGNFDGTNILHLPISYAEYASQNKLLINNLIEQINRIKQKMQTNRNSRPPPLRDDKVITAWNGMMITALSMGGQILDRKDYTEAAITAAQRLLAFDTLPRATLNNQNSGNGKQEDYVFLAEALIQLYDVTNDSKWIEHTVSVTNQMLENFWSEEAGYFFIGGETLPIQSRSLSDNTTPSGNSTAFRLLCKLTKRTTGGKYQNYIKRLLHTYIKKSEYAPHAYAYFQVGALEYLNGEYASTQYMVNGTIRINAIEAKKTDTNVDFTLQIEVANSWHINANKENNSLAVHAESAQHWAINKTIYPEPIDYLDTKIYQGQFTIKGSLTAQGNPPPPIAILTLQLQACTERFCVEPESASILIRTFS